MSKICISILPEASSVPARDIDVLFSAYSSSPDGCESVSFLLDGSEIVLDAGALKKHAMTALAELSSRLMKHYNLLCNEDQEIVFLINDLNTKLHIAVDGNHIRYTQDGQEMAYWVCDEFRDEPSEILGTVCGMICLHGRVFDYRNR